jgi:hypothetical protein
MIHITELAEKDIKMVIGLIFYMFKRIEERLSVIKRVVEDI